MVRQICFNMGELQLILGPMFSGKTTEFISRLHVQRASKRRCLVIKHTKDRRYSDSHVTAHNLNTIEATTTVSCLIEAEREAAEYSVIGIDEAQFFPDVVEFCEKMANAGKLVIVAALDGTFERKPFGRILDLIPLAEDVVKLSAVCACCRKKAAFSGRIVANTEVELIGGADMYRALCRACYVSHNAA